jgi:hypothetical protein
MDLQKALKTNNSNLASEIDQWFVFLNDKCEGPYSSVHVQKLLAESIIGKNDLIWCEEFADWKSISEVEPFCEQLAIPLQFGIQADFQTAQVSKSPMAFQVEIQKLSSEKLNLDKEIAQSKQANPNYNLIDLVDQLDEFKTKSNQKIIPEKYETDKSWSYNKDFEKFNPQFKKINVSGWQSFKLKTRRLLIKYNQKILATGIALGLIWLSYQTYNYFKYPRIAGLSREDIRSIYAAKRESLVDYGPAFTLVLNKDSRAHYLFFGGTNLPQESELSMHIEGVAETLLDSFGVSVEAPLNLKNGIVSSPTFIQENGKVYPTGEYKVIIKCRNCADYNQGNPSLVLLEKTFFIGGQKNQNYDQSLRIYHEKLRSQASSELIEVKQFSDNFEQLLNETNMIFARWHEGRLSVADWQKYHLRWQKFSGQILQMTKDWNPDFINKKFYYSQYYSLLKGLEALLVQVHNGQNEWVLNSKVSSELGTGIYEKSSMIQSTLLMIRTKVTLIEHLPATANGMPPR